MESPVSSYTIVHSAFCTTSLDSSFCWFEFYLGFCWNWTQGCGRLQCHIIHLLFKNSKKHFASRDCLVPRLKLSQCVATYVLWNQKSTFAGSFICDLHRKFLYLDFAVTSELVATGSNFHESFRYGRRNIQSTRVLARSKKKSVFTWNWEIYFSLKPAISLWVWGHAVAPSRFLKFLCLWNVVINMFLMAY